MILKLFIVFKLFEVEVYFVFRLTFINWSIKVEYERNSYPNFRFDGCLDAINGFPVVVISSSLELIDKFLFTYYFDLSFIKPDDCRVLVVNGLV
jgi:hypothetical protein